MRTQRTQFTDIISRVEHVRRSLRLSKSSFAKAISMSPQTYNNFVGAQKSKPNVHLIHGVVQAFQVNPLWLLTGEGKTFSLAPAAHDRLVDGGEQTLVEQSASGLDDVLDSVRELSALAAAIDSELDTDSTAQPPPLSESLEGLKLNFLVSPKETCQQIGKLLYSFHRLIAIRQFDEHRPTH